MRYIVSLYESDAQIAFLVKQGYADFAVTEDSDFLLYGCKEQGGISFWTNQGICLPFGCKPIKMPRFTLLPVKILFLYENSTL